jgi:hypothetical protein
MDPGVFVLPMTLVRGSRLLTLDTVESSKRRT